MAQAQATATEKEGGKEKTKKAPKEVKALATVNAKALSIDVGPRALELLSKANAQEESARDLLKDVDKKRYDVIASVTQAIVKGATVDEAVDLSACFGSDKKKSEMLNDQVFIMLGIKEKVTVGKGEAAKETLNYTKAAAKFFPAKNDSKDDPATKRKAQVKNNFIQIVKRAAQAAEGILQSDATVKMDAKEGTLRISGPAIQKAFGANEVLLNEKQTVKGGKADGSGDLILKQKPSFTAIAAMGAQAHGAQVKTGTNTRGQKVITDPTAALTSVAASVVTLCEKIDVAKMTEGQRKALVSIKSAVDKVLG